MFECGSPIPLFPLRRFCGKEFNISMEVYSIWCDDFVDNVVILYNTTYDVYHYRITNTELCCK